MSSQEVLLDQLKTGLRQAFLALSISVLRAGVVLPLLITLLWLTLLSDSSTHPVKLKRRPRRGTSTAGLEGENGSSAGSLQGHSDAAIKVWSGTIEHRKTAPPPLPDRAPRRFMSYVAILTLCLVVAASVMQLVHPILSGILFQNTFSFDASRPFPKDLYMAIVVMPGITPYLADLVITLRLLHFYPVASTTKRKLTAIFAIPVVLKIGRIVSLSLFWVEFRSSLDRSPTPLDIHGTTYPAATTEYAAQAADTIYSAIFCLWALRNALRGSKQVRVIRAKSFQKRLEQLWNVLVFSFVLPAASSLALLLVSQLHSDPNILGLMIALNAMVCCVNILLSSIAIAAQNARQAAQAETAVLVEDHASAAGDGRRSDGDAASAHVEVYNAGGGRSAFFNRFKRSAPRPSPLSHDHAYRDYNAHGGLEDRKTSGGGSPRLLPYGSYDDLSLPRSAGRGGSLGRRSEGRNALCGETYDVPLRDVKVASAISPPGWSTENDTHARKAAGAPLANTDRVDCESERSSDWIETIARPSEIHDS